MLLQQAIDQVVVFIEQNKLEEWLAVDRYHHGLSWQSCPYWLNFALASLSGITFMCSKPLALHVKGISLFLAD
jgi:hypothetical protein